MVWISAIMISYLQKKRDASCNWGFSSIFWAHLSFCGSFPSATFSKEAFMAVETQTGPKSWFPTFSALENRIGSIEDLSSSGSGGVGTPPFWENYERRYMDLQENTPKIYDYIYINYMHESYSRCEKLDICCLLPCCHAILPRDLGQPWKSWKKITRNWW